VIHQLRSENNNVNIDEIAISERIVTNFQTIGDLGNENYRVIVLGLYKQKNDRFFFNPLDTTLLEVGDYIVAIGYKIFVKEFERHLHAKVKHA